MTDEFAETPAPTSDDCESAVRRLWDYVDRGLPAAARDEVDAHLATCELCARRFTFASSLKDELAKLGAALSMTEIDEVGRAALSRRIRAALRGARPGEDNRSAGA